MKKHLAFLLALLMALSLVSCGAGEKETDGEPTTPPATDGSGAPADDAEKEESEAVTPPETDGSDAVDTEIEDNMDGFGVLDTEEVKPIQGNIVFYCAVQAYEEIEDMQELEEAVLYMQNHAVHKNASVSVWLCEDEEHKSNTEEYYATLYENASEVLSELMYTNIYPNPRAPFVGMSIPYTSLSAQTLVQVAQNELIAMVIVSDPIEDVPMG